jgi:hypothetical protein
MEMTRGQLMDALVHLPREQRDVVLDDLILLLEARHKLYVTIEGRLYPTRVMSEIGEILEKAGLELPPPAKR